MTLKMQTKTIETIRLHVEVQNRDIIGGKCMLISKCMHKVAIERALRNRDPKGGDHRVRVDGSDVKFNLRGHRWHGNLPRKAKLKLLQFDKERNAREKAEREGIDFKSKVEPHGYTLEMVKGGAIQPFTRERQEQINAARRRRIAAGKPDNKHYDLRHRVQGLGTV
jgi:hypothetical protein